MATEGMESKASGSSHRRAHTKSRAGCIHCKRRKVKCSEEHPSCSNCRSRGALCEYTLDPSKTSIPEVSKNRKDRTSPVRILPQPSIISGKTIELTYADLRFLHHFLTVAYPHLPAGNESIWLHEVPPIAEDRPFLMHALLGLGGSHLAMMKAPIELLSIESQGRTTVKSALPSPANSAGTPYANSSSISSGYTATSSSSSSTVAARALHHRSLALSGLSNALTLNDWSLTSVDSMLATAYALTFQATYLPHDGLVDFMTMVRGCALITQQILEGQQAAGMGFGLRSSFSLDPNAHVKALEGEFFVREVFGGTETFVSEANAQSLDLVMEPSTIEGGLHSLSLVRTYLENDVGQSSRDDVAVGLFLRYHLALSDALAAHKLSFRQAYIRYTNIYEVWWQSSTAEFQLLTDLGIAMQTTPALEHLQTRKVKEAEEGHPASMLLMMWFLVLDLLLAPVFEVPYRNRKNGLEAVKRRALVTVGWMRGLESRLLRTRRQGRSPKNSMEDMISWPMQIANKAEEEAVRQLRNNEKEPG